MRFGDPMTYLLDELQFTYADKLKVKDYNSFQALYDRARCDSPSLKAYLADLKKIIKAYAREAGTTLVVDQYNEVGKVRKNSKDISATDRVILGYNMASTILQALLEACQKFICVSSMTDEDSISRSQGEILHFLSEPFDNKQATLMSAIDDDIDILLKTTETYLERLLLWLHC